MVLFPPRVARILIAAVAVLAVIMAGAPGGERLGESDKAVLQARSLMSSTLVVELLSAVWGSDHEQVQESRAAALSDVERVLPLLPDDAPERPRLRVLRALLSGDAQMLPEPLPPGLPGWVEARARAVASGFPEDPASRDAVRAAAWAWIVAVFLGLLTLVVGVFALTLSPRIFARSQMGPDRRIAELRIPDAFALLSVAALGTAAWGPTVAELRLSSPTLQVVTTLFPAGLATVALVAWALRRAGCGWERVGLFRAPHRRVVLRWVGFGYLGFALALPTALVAQWITTSIIPGAPPIDPMVVLASDVFAEGGAPWFILTTALVAPAYEELLFRGLLYGTLRAHRSAVIANVAQALTFAVLHFQPDHIPLLFTLGVVMGLVRERTGHLLPSIVMHGLWNASYVLYLKLLLAP